MNECELQQFKNANATHHQRILCHFFAACDVLTDALGLQGFDLLSDLHTEGRGDGPGVDLGAAATDGAGGEGRCLAGRDHGWL